MTRYCLDCGYEKESAYDDGSVILYGYCESCEKNKLFGTEAEYESQQ